MGKTSNFNYFTYRHYTENCFFPLEWKHAICQSELSGVLLLLYQTCLLRFTFIGVM